MAGSFERSVGARPRSASLLIAALVTALTAAFLPASASVAPVASRVASAHVAVDPDLESALVGARIAPAVVQVADHARGAALAVIEATGGTRGLDLDLIGGFAAQLTSESLEGLRGLAGVRAVSFDAPVTIQHDIPLGESKNAGDHRYDEAVRADEAREAGWDGSGVGIGVIDTGITEVSDLEGRVWPGIDLSGSGSTADGYGHGTFIAGIAAGDGVASNGRYRGIATDAHVVPIRIAGDDGSTDVSHVLAAIEFAVSFQDELDLRILNLSLGTNSTQTRHISPMNYAVQRAWDAGLVVIVSGGNHGDMGPGYITKPADDPLVITVGATDHMGTKRTRDDIVAPYSSRGPSIADGVVKPDIVAPGSHIIAPKAPGSQADVNVPEAHIRKDYMRGSGTSFAAGVVSGAVAMILEAHPDWTPDQVKGAITSTAAPGPVGDPNVDGAGILDVMAAIELVDPPLANQDVVGRSTGLGSLAADRGDLDIDVSDGLLTLDLDGEVTARNLIFDALQYTTTSWDGTHWGDSQWGGTHWGGTHWGGTHWGSNGWLGTHWGGTHWGGTHWGGTHWGGTAWYVAEWR